MFLRKDSCTVAVLLGFALLCPRSALSQHHGVDGAGAGGIPGATGRPTGLDEKDPLKDFHHALAVQVTHEQIVEFQNLVKDSVVMQSEKFHNAGVGKLAGIFEGQMQSLTIRSA